MSGLSDRHFDLNFGEEAAMPSQDNVWRPSFLSLTGTLTVGYSVMKNDMTAAVVARNLLTPKDNILLSEWSDELAVKDSLALSVQYAGFMSNMAQSLFAQTRQVESLAAEVISLKQEIRWLKHENKQLHRLAHDYATNIKRKLDQLQESDGQILFDHQSFVGEAFVGEAFVGQAFMGQAFVGEAFVGQAFVGQTFIGQAFVGEVFVGQAFVGQAFVGQAFVGQAFVGQAFVGEAFVGEALELKLL
ncbi:hypothetical protein ACFX1X_000049 [Malus domestica]